VELFGRDRKLFKHGPPIYVSWQMQGGLLRRTQPLFQTRQYVQRIDLYPHVMVPMHWKGFTLTPSFAVRETGYGSSIENGDIGGGNLLRSSREFDAELTLPSLERIYNKPTSFFGQRFKHVIEPRATFRYVTGVNNFNDVIRFDEVDLWSNTNELELSLANRFYGKAKNGEVKEVLSWEVRQKRFFDPTFGGAVVAGRRNEVSTALDETAFAFLDQPRGYSPIISELRSNPFGRIGVEWRTDYDPMRGTLVNNSISGDAHFDRWNVNLGYTMIKCVPVRLVGNNQDPCTMQTPPGDSVLSPPSNQFRGRLVMGDENRRGWNAAFEAFYDFRTDVMQFANSQMTYNTDCCAFSFQYRRFGFGIRNENQFRFSLVIANIGSFGTLKRQERLF
jgi:LPS-assembly protein